jgi:hypothetical protein
MTRNYLEIYDRLYAYCEADSFAGHDPFDGLNSVLFQLTPLKHSRVARLAWLQMIKRSPVDLRSVLRVPKGVNSKGLALFALAELSRYRATGDERHAANARVLLDRLLDLGIRDSGTLGFGYNFDWQSSVFFAPKGTPAIVPTAFASQAFAEGDAAFGEDRYAHAVAEIASFVLTRLNRSVETEDEICFSYTPLDESMVYNASLLAAECLARSDNGQAADIAIKALRFVIRRQRADGAWEYGAAAGHEWVDSFHTAYVLLSIRRISDRLKLWDDGTRDAYRRGLDYWRDNFFFVDGTPKYYDHKTYPIDIHAAAVAIAALAELGETELAHRVARWTIKNMLDVDGFFYYRVGRVIVDQTPFMRWGQAWMAYALARLIELERA